MIRGFLLALLAASMCAPSASAGLVGTLADEAARTVEHHVAAIDARAQASEEAADAYAHERHDDCHGELLTEVDDQQARADENATRAENGTEQLARSAGALARGEEEPELPSDVDVNSTDLANLLDWIEERHAENLRTARIVGNAPFDVGCDIGHPYEVLLNGTVHGEVPEALAAADAILVANGAHPLGLAETYTNATREVRIEPVIIPDLTGLAHEAVCAAGIPLECDTE